MRLIDRLGHARAIAMFGLDRPRQADVGRPHLDLERLAPPRKLRLDRLQPRFLLVGQRQFAVQQRSEEHTSELQSLMRISYAVFCLKKKKDTKCEQNSKT